MRYTQGVKKIAQFLVCLAGALFLVCANASEVMSPTVIQIKQNAQVNIELSNTDIP